MPFEKTYVMYPASSLATFYRQGWPDRHQLGGELFCCFAVKDYFFVVDYLMVIALSFHK